MLFITPTSSTKAAKDYFARELARSNYYTKDAKAPAGQWHGLGAEMLGLTGDVAREQFFRLCDNLDPQTGAALTARTKGNRRVLYDFTFDAPKAVTLVYELGGDERILDAFRASVAETMDEMEAQVKTRVRMQGSDADRCSANLVWAEFVHRTARPVDGVPDPQLHCHAVAFNATFDPVEERWKAAQFGDLVRDKLYYQAAFHCRLAGRLAALGYDVRRDGTSFTLAGVAPETLGKFSRRSEQISAEAARLGIMSPKVRGELGRRTREAKPAGESIDELRSLWKARLTNEERQALGTPAGSSIGAGGPQQQESRARAAFDFALAHSFERASVLPERKLVAEALMQGVGSTSVSDVWAQAQAAQLIRRVIDGQVLTTTRDVCREEIAMLAFAREGRGQHAKLGGSKAPSLDASLSDEQRRAAQAILGSRDRVTGLRGGAGTGKTRMMQATVAAIEQAGTRVFPFAPSAKASRDVLRAEGFAGADTVERLLTDKQLQQAVRGQLLWIDEAGLLSSRDMKRVFDLAKAERCRVVLSGDSAQHSSVGRGDALRLLERFAGIRFARLTSIRRQTDDEYRAAVRDISSAAAGGPAERTRLEAGLARLWRMGAVVEADAATCQQRLAADYVAATAPRRDGRRGTALVVSPTHREGEQVAGRIRAELQRCGRISGRERAFLSLKAAGLTQAERGSADSYRGGQLIRFHQNAPGFVRGERVAVSGVGLGAVNVIHADGRAGLLPLGLAQRFEVYDARTLALARGDCLRITLNGFAAVAGRAAAKRRLNNGDVYEVAGFTRAGDIKLVGGSVVPMDYGGITQGYVVTSHASQGSTVDTVLIALGRESLAAVNRQQFYVSVSRGRQAVRLYTDDKEALTRQVQVDASRLSATELMRREPVARRRLDRAGRLIAHEQRRLAYQAIVARLGAHGDSAAREMRHG